MPIKSEISTQKTGRLTPVKLSNGGYNPNEYFIGLDWVQLHLEHKRDFGEGATVRYKVKRTGQTKVFRNIYGIYDAWGKLVASYACDPAECILKPGHGILKLDNRLLYTEPDIYLFVRAFLEELNLRFVGITRLDIAFDFHQFRTMQPQQFIKRFLSEKILKVKRTKFRLTGEHDFKNTYDWIAFGRATSDVTYKLYNKTKEQKDATRKPWIWDAWKKSSLLKIDDRDVWRLEFTVNATTAKLSNSILTDVKFHDLKMLRLENYAALFKGLFNSYFRFVRLERDKTRKDRMPEITLLVIDQSISAFKILNICPETKESGRMAKIMINKLNSHAMELRGIDDDFSIDTKSIISKLIDQYGLQNWADKKGIDFIPMNYAEDIANIKIEFPRDANADDAPPPVNIKHDPGFTEPFIYNE